LFTFREKLYVTEFLTDHVFGLIAKATAGITTSSKRGN